MGPPSYMRSSRWPKRRYAAHDYSYSKGKVHPRIGHDVAESSRGASVLLFFNLGARWGWVVNATPRPLYHCERDLVPIVRETGWGHGPVRLKDHRDSDPEPSSPYGVAVPTSLSRLRPFLWLKK